MKKNFSPTFVSALYSLKNFFSGKYYAFLKLIERFFGSADEQWLNLFFSPKTNIIVQIITMIIDDTIERSRVTKQIFVAMYCIFPRELCQASTYYNTGADGVFIAIICFSLLYGEKFSKMCFYC